MKTSRLLLGVAVAAFWAGEVSAVSTETQLSPKNATVNGLAFRVTARDVGQHKEIVVAVRAQAGKEVSPFLAGRLCLFEGKRLVLSCPVEKAERDGELRYQVTVASGDVDKVQFSFNEYAFAKQVDGKGAVKVVAMPAVDRYWFHLKDFINVK
jgi:hypothetical protein